MDKRSTFMSEKKEVVFGVGKRWRKTFQSMLPVRLRNVFQCVAKGGSQELCFLKHRCRGRETDQGEQVGKGLRQEQELVRREEGLCSEP